MPNELETRNRDLTEFKGDFANWTSMLECADDNYWKIANKVPIFVSGKEGLEIGKPLDSETRGHGDMGYFVLGTGYWVLGTRPLSQAYRHTRPCSAPGAWPCRELHRLFSAETMNQCYQQGTQQPRYLW